MHTLPLAASDIYTDLSLSLNSTWYATFKACVEESLSTICEMLVFAQKKSAHINWNVPSVSTYKGFSVPLGVRIRALMDEWEHVVPTVHRHQL